jgi:transposase
VIQNRKLKEATLIRRQLTDREYPSADPRGREVHESTQALVLINGLTLVSLIADKGHDNDAFRAHLAEAEIDAVISPLVRRTAEIAYNANTYGLQQRIECFIKKIKHYRRVATRFEKTACSFFSMLCLAGSSSS